MKLAYVTAYNARDRSKWSGLGYYMGRALEQQSQRVEYIGPLETVQKWRYRAKKQVYERWVHKRYLTDREPAVVRGFGLQAAARVARLDVDVVFSPGTIPIAYLDTDRPIVFWTDSTFAGMVDFYPEFTNLAQESLRNGAAVERAALDRAALAIYSSDWAAATALQTYRVDQAKVHVVPFGANIDHVPTLEIVRAMVAARSTTVCRLLFLGVTWFRKGGDVAVEVARQLNASGIPTELLVVGCRPRIRGPLPGFVRYCGTLSKSPRTRLPQLERLMSKTHFLVLPTRADCTPVVFSEANAFGVPCIATRVGGIASIVRDGVNGATFAPGAAISTYCDYVSSYFSDRKRYLDLALSAYREYDTRLNWSASGHAVHQLMMHLGS